MPPKLLQGSKNLFSNTRQSGSNTRSFSCQNGSKAEISVSKMTNAEKCTTGVFLKWFLFDWLACLSHSGKLSSCKCWTLCRLFETFLLFAAGAFSPSSFEPSRPSSNSSFSSSSLTGRSRQTNGCSRRTLVSADRCTGALFPFKLELKKTHVDDWSAAPTDRQNAYDGLERRSSGKAPRPRGWFTLIATVHENPLTCMYSCW